MSEPIQATAAETGHVLFLDLVEYSQLPAEVQPQVVGALSEVVRATPEFRRAEAAGELLTLSTGDGVALVFFRYPLAPVECAVEIVRALRERPDQPLRIGIHSGPVTRVRDVTGRENVTGDGINRAQRVMDCGDAGHILVSGVVAEALQGFGAWRAGLQDLGECTVKHGERVRLYNLYLEQAGNPVRPSRLGADPGAATPPAAPPGRGVGWPLSAEGGPGAGGVPAGAGTGSGAPLAVPTAPVRPGTVALLYKRHAPDSAHLLTLLQRELAAAGYKVFVDRHLATGVDWARELEHQVQEAYAVIPLLSAESIWSEMVEAEIRTAHDTQESRGGLPRILPVRVKYEGALPDPLAHMVGRLQYVRWQGTDDDATLVSELLRALEGPVAAPPKLEPVGGAVPLDSHFYVVRPTDGEFLAALSRRDSIVLVKGARQMGKTSLLTRGLQQARETGARCVRTDFQKLTTAELREPDAFFLALATMLADQLNLEDDPADSWNARRGGAHNFERFLRRQVLGKTEAAHVWALDEVDRLFTCPFGTDVFALFRSWHNDRAYEPDGPWSRLTLAIAYATEAHLFITDVNQSPFNVGTRLTLEDFTPDEIAELNRRYGSPLRSTAEVDQFHSLTGGQPYLCRRALDRMVEQRLSLTTLAASADQDDGVFGDHLRRLLVTISSEPETLEVVRGLLNGQGPGSAATFYRLRSGGLLAGSSERDWRLRCGLYGTYLSRNL